MHIILIILSVIAGIIVLLLLTALFMKRNYKTYQEITVLAPVAEVFDYLKQIRNQDNFNKWVMTDPAMQKEFKGTDGTVGFVYAWNGNKQAGEGEQEITGIEEGKKIEMEIRFIRPFAGIANATMTTQFLSDKQTKVGWSTSSTMRYPINLMLPIIVKMLEKDMASSLLTLKTILEKTARLPA